MDSSNKAKNWFDENKKYVQIGGAVALSVVAYALCRNKKIPFPEEIKSWSFEEMNAEWNKYLPEFHRTNVKPIKMLQLESEIDIRKSRDLFTKIPPNLASRWTDACRWEKD